VRVEIARGIERDDAARSILVHDEQITAADGSAVRDHGRRRCRRVTDNGDRSQAAGHERPATYQVRHGYVL
jgi:hypothetical protein